MESMLNTMVSEMIRVGVEYARETIVGSGLADVSVTSWTAEYEAENPELFNWKTLLKKLKFKGLGDFEIHEMRFILSEQKVVFDVSIPELLFSLGRCTSTVNYLFDRTLKGGIRGQLSVVKPRITGEAFLSVPGLFDVSLESVNLKFSLQSIKSNLKVHMNDTDYTNTVNTFLNKTFPSYIKKYQDKINFALEMFIIFVAHAKSQGNAEED